MNQQRGFPTVTELVETMLSNVRYVIPKDQQNDADKVDPTTISRTSPVVDVFRDAARHHLKEVSEAAVEETVTAAIVEFNKDQKEMRGVELRHPEIWCLYPVETVHAQLDAMMYRNQQINGVITPQAFADWLVEQGANTRTPEELHKKSSIRDAMAEAWNMDDELQYADIIQYFADEYYVPLTGIERHQLERKHTLETICEFLTEKLHQREPNDGLVQYGVMRGAERMEQEREQFQDQWGGIKGIGAGLAAKHISDLFEILGSTFGIIDRVPCSVQ